MKRFPTLFLEDQSLGLGMVLAANRRETPEQYYSWIHPGNPVEDEDIKAENVPLLFGTVGFVVVW